MLTITKTNGKSCITVITLFLMLIIVFVFSYTNTIVHVSRNVAENEIGKKKFSNQYTYNTGDTCIRNFMLYISKVKNQTSSIIFFNTIKYIVDCRMIIYLY